MDFNVSSCIKHIFETIKNIFARASNKQNKDISTIDHNINNYYKDIFTKSAQGDIIENIRIINLIFAADSLIINSIQTIIGKFNLTLIDQMCLIISNITEICNLLNYEINV